MKKSYKGNRISTGILLPFFVTVHEVCNRMSEAVPELLRKNADRNGMAERGIGGIWQREHKNQKRGNENETKDEKARNKVPGTSAVCTDDDQPPASRGTGS